MDPTSPGKAINRIERDLEATNPLGGHPPAKPGNKSLDAVLVTALLLFVVSAALVLAGRLSPKERMQLTAGAVGGAGGLLSGYGIGRIRP